MLQKLNERIQGLVAWIVIILIAVTFTLFGVDYYMQSHQASDIEVSVNGEPITKHAVELNYRRGRQQRDLSKMTAASEAALKKQVLEGMINNEIALQSAKASGFEVTSAEAQAAIIAIPQFQEDGRFSSERYQQALNSAMFTPQSFEKEVKQGMILNQLRFAFMGTAFALPEEIKRFVQLYMQTRDYDYLEISPTLFANHIKIPEQALKDYYKKHQKEFIDPEKVSIEYIRLSMDQIRNSIKVTDQDIARYYEENKNNYLVPAQWHVAHLLLSIPAGASEEAQDQVKQKAEEIAKNLQKAPERFEEFVKTQSADKLSVANGGLLPWIEAGHSPFDKALSTLTKAGQISSPLKTEHGYEIFKLVDYKPASQKPLSQVKNEISQQLAGELAQTSYTQALEKLTDLSYQTPDTLEPAAEALKLKIETTEPFSREGGNASITKNKQVTNAAFSHDVLDLGNNSEPVQLDNNSVIVLRIKKHIPASEKPLEQVKNAIEKQLTFSQATKDAQQLGMELLSARADKEKQEKIIEDNKLAWHQVKNATRDTDKANNMINDLAFGLAKVNTMEGKSLANGSYAIVQLKKVTDGQYHSLDKEQQASLAQQIESSYGVMDYDLYLNQLIANAKVVR